MVSSKGCGCNSALNVAENSQEALAMMVLVPGLGFLCDADVGRYPVAFAANVRSPASNEISQVLYQMFRLVSL